MRGGGECEGDGERERGEEREPMMEQVNERSGSQSPLVM